MSDLFKVEGNRLVRKYDYEKIWIEPLGKDSLRVRCTKEAEMPNEDWALLPQPEYIMDIKIDGDKASITNGKITCHINEYGFISFENKKRETLIKEKWQTSHDINNRISLMIPGRELKPIIGGDYHATVRFEGNESEKFYGLGQHQEPFLNLKGCVFELAQRNSQVTIPFVISNLGYGLLWNNPAYGHIS